MKYLCCALALLLALFLGCLMTVQRVAVLTGEVSALLDAARREALAEQLGEASLQIDEAIALWQRHQGFWGTVLRHAETDDLSCELEALAQYARLADRQEVLCRIAGVQERLRHLAEMEQLRYDNFL